MQDHVFTEQEQNLLCPEGQCCEQVKLGQCVRRGCWGGLQSTGHQNSHHRLLSPGHETWKEDRKVLSHLLNFKEKL